MMSPSAERRPREGAASNRQSPAKITTASLSPAEPSPFDSGPCPDCGRAVVSGELAHESTCPIARSTDETSEADREWFDAHPLATQRYRPLALAERDAVLRDLSPLPEGWQLVGKVRVVSVAPGVRVRDYRGIVAVARNCGAP